jgi:hypothetical protein
MTTKTDDILARKAKYDRVERVVDTLGRTIGVKRLKPSQQLHVQELAPALDGVTTVVDEDPESPNFGKSFDVPKSSPLIMAASVVEIDSSPIAFPKTRAELNSVLDLLDSEGLSAVSEALSALSKAESGVTVDVAATAKN